MGVVYLFDTEKNEYKSLTILCIAHLVISAFDGLLYGAKGSMLEPILRFAVTYIFLCYVLKPNFRIGSRLWIKLFIGILIFILSFTALSEFIGREMGQSNSYSLAVYCGAEIKNFDIYMHGKDGHIFNSNFGEATFSNLYEELTGIDKGDTGNFQSVGCFPLGNVYTQYRSFHEDFGILGTFLMTFVSAVIVMFVYNKAWYNKKKINLYLLLYTPMAFWLFMSFFSNTFINTLFRIGYLKAVFYISLYTFISNKYFIRSYAKN